MYHRCNTADIYVQEYALKRLAWKREKYDCVYFSRQDDGPAESGEGGRGGCRGVLYKTMFRIQIQLDLYHWPDPDPLQETLIRIRIAKNKSW